MNPPDDRRAEVLRLVAEVGQAEAARRTGVPLGTVKTWARRHGETTTNTGRVQAANDARSAAWAQRRLIAADRLGTLAERLIDAVEAKLADVDRLPLRDLTVTLATVVDKAQLLSGQATERTETIAPDRSAEAEAEVARVLGLVRDPAA